MENQQNQDMRYVRMLDICNRERACIDAMAHSKAYKLAYLATRFEKEFIKGDKASRKAFIDWVLHRGKGGPISKMHYVLRMDMALNQMYRELKYSMPEFEKFAGLSHEELQAWIRAKKQEQIEQLIGEYEGKKIVVFPEVVDWNIPLFQRPQQMGMAFAQEKVLFIYVTPNYQDAISGLTKVQDYCYLITREDMLDVLKTAQKMGKETIMEIYSTDNLHPMADVDEWRKYCSAVLYEYIDEISDEITGKVPKQTLERHAALLRDESVYVVATADKLYQEVVSVRGSDKRCLNSGNGVDCGHFTVEKSIDRVPENIRPIIEKNKPIIGYFGAIANWFDFELIAYAARQRPEYEFLMIGPHYGSHDVSVLGKLESIENLHFVGTVEYRTLPYVASYFTVATIPFVINEITESTSPIKLFEYMAMGKPCVTTAMRECYKYPVVRVAENRQEYVEYLDRGVAGANDPAYVAQLLQTADQNSWREKAREIVRLLDEEG